jgi:hypothetical protein
MAPSDHELRADILTAYRFPEERGISARGLAVRSGVAGRPAWLNGCGLKIGAAEDAQFVGRSE